MSMPKCINCNGEYVYEYNGLYACPECFKEWSKLEENSLEEENIIKDSNGNILQDGDSVAIIKNLKVKGATNDLKQGTKVKNIRLVYNSDHNIDCKIDGFGQMSLKSEFVKKI